jgi:hypothetical protein
MSTALLPPTSVYYRGRRVGKIYQGGKKVWPPAWTPDLIPGLVAWVDPRQATGLVDGDNITSYIEQSPAHRIFNVGAGAPSLPKFRASSINGKPRIELAGSGMQCDGVSLGPAGLTYVIVQQAGAINSYQMMQTCHTPGNGYEQRYNGWATQIVCDYSNGGTAISQATTMLPNKDYINTLRVSTALGKAEHWYNDNAASRMQGPTPPFMPAGVYPVRFGFRADGYWSGALIAEVLFFAGPVSDANLTLLWNYLKTKHGVS